MNPALMKPGDAYMHQWSGQLLVQVMLSNGLSPV